MIQKSEKEFDEKVKAVVCILKMEQGVRVKEYRQPVEAAKGKKTDSSLGPSEGAQSCCCGSFSPVKTHIGLLTS